MEKTRSEMDRLRGRYAELIDQLTAAGRGADAAACARLAVEQGFWAHPQQRPLRYFAGLPAVTIYDPRKFWVTGYLEERAAGIRAEVDRVTAASMEEFTPVEEPILGHGRWDQVVFYEAGQKFARSCERFPQIAGILEEIPEEMRAAGVIMLSWLHPQSHIVPHCGHTNGRLRLHLGIRTSPGAHIRVHDRDLRWEEGRCIVFDDSFEHEVWHEGDQPRVILLFDLFHPALPDAGRQELMAESAADLEQKARRLMRERGLRRIARTGEGSVEISPNRQTELLLSRYLKQASWQSLEVRPDGTLEVRPA